MYTTTTSLQLTTTTVPQIVQYAVMYCKLNVHSMYIKMIQEIAKAKAMMIQVLAKEA